MKNGKENLYFDIRGCILFFRGFKFFWMLLRRRCKIMIVVRFFMLVIFLILSRRFDFFVIYS